MAASANVSGFCSLSMLRGPLVTGYTTSMNYLRRRSVVMKASESGEFDREQITSPSQVSPSSTSPRTRLPTRPVTAESAQELIQELLDPEQFGTRGEAWFLAQLVLILLVAFPPSGLRQIVDVAGGCLLLAGLAFITLGGLNLGHNLSPVPKPRDMHSLVTDGTYQIIRHPMYGGIILAAA
ncbi:hypothetical protein Ndes2526A_g07896 [Nannochloris sp. 'desiccata']